MKKITSLLLVCIILCSFITPIEAATGVSFYNNLCPIVGYGWENEDFPTYTTVECTTKSGEIFASDKCTITKVYINSDGKWICKVKYPLTSGGTKTAYAKFGRFIKSPAYNYQTIVANKTVKTAIVSTKSASSSNSIAEGSTYYVVRVDGSKAQVLYEASDCYKLGWINNYTIEFDANGGSDAPSSFTKVEGETAKLPTTIPTKKGYTFKGWNLEKDGSGSSYKAGGNIGKNSSVTLYAQWEATKYTISYTYNNGTASNPASYYITTATFKLNNPSKKGYTFKGWTGSNGTTPQTSVSIAKGSTGNKSYTANYTINSYTVSAVSSDSDFGSVSGGGKYNYGTTIYLTATPTTGHCFSKWHDGDTSNPRKVTVSENTTYTADFVKNKYTITVNASESYMGTTTGSGTYDYGSKVTIAASENSLYEFVAWDDGYLGRFRDITVTGKKTYTAYFKLSQCEHQYGDWIVEKNANCTESGIQYVICSKCNNRIDDVIQAKGHNYGSDIVDKEPTCTENGEKHRDCLTCGDKETPKLIESLGHSYQWKIIKEPTCSEKGLKVEICPRCIAVNSDSITEIDLIEHNYEWIVDLEATCTENGHQYKKCAVCAYQPLDENEDNIIPATGHNTVEYVDDKCCEPQNGSPGIRKTQCVYCKIISTEYYFNIVEKGIIKVSDVQADVGGTVSIPISISENPGFCAFNICVDYDREIFRPTSVEKGELIDDTKGTLTSNVSDLAVDSNRDFHVNYARISGNVTGDGSIIIVNFDVIGNTKPDVYEIEVICSGEAPDMVNVDDVTGETEIISSGYYGMSNVNSDQIHPECVGGSVTTSVNFIKGDVNCDLRVDSMDVVYILKHRVNWKDLYWSDIHEQAADLHHDNTINIKDSNRLMMLLANKDLVESESQVNSISLLSADDQVVDVNINSTTASAGSYVYVPIYISNNDGISAFDIKLYFDKVSLIPVEIISDDFTGIVSNLNQYDNAIDEVPIDDEFTTLNVCWSNSQNIAGDYKLFTIKFFVNNNVQNGQVLPIEILKSEFCSISEDESEIVDVVPTVSQGKVTILTDTYTYAFESVLIKNNTGDVLTTIPKEKFTLDVIISSSSNAFIPCNLIAATYDIKNKFVGLSKIEVTSDMLAETIEISIDNTKGDVEYIKLLIWSSINDLKPLAKAYIVENTYSYNINSVEIQDSDGSTYENIPSFGDVALDIQISGVQEGSPTLFVATYGEKGALISLNSTDEVEWEEGVGKARINVEKTEGIESTKIFVWDTLNNLKPLSEVYSI